MTQMDTRMVEDWNQGLEVPDIAARYAVPAAYVDRVLDDARAAAQQKRRFDFSWNPWPNRIFYSAIAALLINVVADTKALGWVIGVVLFVLTSVIVSARRS